MKKSIFNFGLHLCLAIFSLAGKSNAQSPTDGFMLYADSFYVQRPYNVPISARFSDTGGMYTTWVLGTDKPFEIGNPTDHRTEMRWITWPNQSIEHMWVGDVMYEPGTDHTCIMQVKANTPSTEAIYLRVLPGGDLFSMIEGKTVLTNYYGKWFNLKSAYNASTNTARVWINDQLVGTYRGPSAKDWYFKNGCYGEYGAIAKVHFKNISTWVKGQSASISYPSPESQARGSRQLTDANKSLSIFDVRGRSVKDIILRADSRRDVSSENIFLIWTRN